MSNSSLRWEACWLLLTALLATAGPVRAEISKPSPLAGLELVGEARYRVLIWNLFEARLYSPSGSWGGTPPFALSLTYLRKFRGAHIADRSVSEIRDQGFSDEDTLARWHGLLQDLIPDVGVDDQIIGVAEASGATQFYFNGKLIGGIAEPAFTERFFAIWLGERTSAPEVRLGLIGAQP